MRWSTAECERQKIERTEYRFSRRDVRGVHGLGRYAVESHLGRLEELEYLLAHRGGRGQSFVYELVFAAQGDGGRPVMPGLIDVEKLGGHNYDGNDAGVRTVRGAGGAERRGKSGPSRRGGGGGRGRGIASIHRVQGLFTKESRKTLAKEETEENPRRSRTAARVNGNGTAHQGGMSWPA